MKHLLQSALDKLHGLPPLEQTVFPGDRVLLLPGAEIVTETILLAELAALLHSISYDPETESGGAAVLIDETEETSAGKKLESILPPGVRLLVHRPNRPGSLAILGVNAADEPIALAREITECDLVVPVSRFRRKKLKDDFGPVFPRFSDTETRMRFAEAKGPARKKLALEIDEVARRLGILLAVQILQQKGKPPRIAAGLPDEVTRFLSETPAE